MKPEWKKYLLYAAVVVGVTLLFMLEETIRLGNTGFGTKTLWDWMELLIIPSFLAGGAFFLNWSEHNTDHEIATDRQQEAVLQAYLDRMADSLVKEKLRTSKNKEIRNVARIRTLTVLRGLDANRKGMLLRFLRDSSLIDVIELAGADFSKTKLNGADLSGANLCGIVLTGANLRESNLSGANLMESSLSEADLRESNLIGSDLYRAILRGADLRGADLSEAQVSNEQLAVARSLKGAIMPDGTMHE